MTLLETQMAKFTIKALDTKTGQHREFEYDNQLSSLTENGISVVKVTAPKIAENVFPVAKESPGKKSTDLGILKISLGLNCNYECTYCSQRFVPRADASNPDDIEPFLDSLTQNLTSPPRKIEFWGGEPFVYWKTLKPLAERLKQMYPDTSMSIITNGSLLDAEKNEWIDSMGFFIGISHDGPGYHVRGIDPMDNPAQREQIMDLYKRLKPQRRISINAMAHAGNSNRAAVQEWMIKNFGDDVVIGEGSFVDPYDEGGMSSMLRNHAEHYSYRNSFLAELRTGSIKNFVIAQQKLDDMIGAIYTGRLASTVGQKCGMDRSDRLAVDLFGNVLTCQNVSTKGVAPNGESHHTGHISDLANVKMKTSTHWSNRDECPKCPVVQMCKGSCMYLDGELWDAACDSSFSDNIPIFAFAIEYLTGCLPYYIDGPQRENRKDIFGAVNGVPADKPKRKIIPIMEAE